jgi:hypothetical protein
MRATFLSVSLPPPPSPGAKAFLLLLGALACSSPAGPRAGIALLVVNGTCQMGRCEPVHVLGFPGNQPHTPGGFWSLDLGLVIASSACLTLPPSATFNVIGVSDDGTRADTTTYTWTTADPLSLGAQPARSSRLLAAPTTTAFVPASAAGWGITLPGGSEASPAQACTP